MLTNRSPLKQRLSALANRRQTSAEAVRECLDRSNSEQGRLAFREIFPASAQAAADLSDRAREERSGGGPLSGLAVSVKDLFDIAGRETRAGSIVLADAPPADDDAKAVRRLRGAGAAIVGRTNMTEFAYSGLGVNPHYGTPRNPWDPARIPGGSSSGAAVSVAEGMAHAAIGSDTGGSVRIPAALCGLTGFKPTQARVDRTGVYPLSWSLDCLGPIALTVDCCARIDSVLADEYPSALQPSSLKALRLGLPQRYVLEGLDAQVSAAFERALRRLSTAGALIIERRFDNLEDISELLAGGGITAAESYATLGKILAERGNQLDPRVRVRIQKGGSITSADYLHLLHRRAEQMAHMDVAMREFDALLCPTTAAVAPRFTDLETEEGYTQQNLLMLRNATVSNMLDLPALSLPCQAPGELPVGLMLMGARGSDRRLLDIGAACQEVLGQPSLDE